MSFKDWHNRIQKSMENIEKFQDEKGNNEKIAQQKLVINNNNNPDSKWFCVDMEYVMKRKDKKEESFGRFDIVAISKTKPHKVALIELKFKAGALVDLKKFLFVAIFLILYFETDTNKN